MSIHSRVTLTGLSALGFHGVFDHERRHGQTFIVDVSLEFDTRPAAESDRIDDTMNYASVAQLVHARIIGDPVNLIETLAENIAADVFVMNADGAVGLTAVEVTVHKPQAPIEHEFTDVSVSIRRERP